METNISERASRWPLPPVLLQAALCLLTFGSAAAFGRIGLAAAIILVVCLPTRGLLSLLRQGDYSGIAAVYLATMMVANIDALALLFNEQKEEGSRASWPIVLGAIVCAFYRLPKLRGEFIPALLLFLNLLLMRVLSAGDEILRFALNQTAFLFALMLFLTVLVSKPNRDALVEKLVLVAAACAGHCSYEMLFPDSDLSISSTQIQGIVGRAAGLYANSNNAGVTLAFIALVTCFTCHGAPFDKRDKFRLISLHLFCLLGIGMTFSRQGILILAMSLPIMTAKVSGSQLRKLVLLFPLIAASGLILLFGAFELLSQTDQGLSFDAKARYGSLKRIVTLGLVSTDMEDAELSKDRLDFLRDTAQYWMHPSLLGEGQEFMEKEFREIHIPHNQFLMILIEDGYLGAVLFLLGMAACIGTRWSTTWENVLNAVVAVLAIIALAIGTYNMFDYRFFALPLAMLMWVCRTPLFVDSRPQRRSPDKPPLAAKTVENQTLFHGI